MKTKQQMVNEITERLGTYHSIVEIRMYRGTGCVIATLGTGVRTVEWGENADAKTLDEAIDILYERIYESE